MAFCINWANRIASAPLQNGIGQCHLGRNAYHLAHAQPGITAPPIPTSRLPSARIHSCRKPEFAAFRTEDISSSFQPRTFFGSFRNALARDAISVARVRIALEGRIPPLPAILSSASKPRMPAAHSGSPECPADCLTSDRAGRSHSLIAEVLKDLPHFFPFGATIRSIHIPSRWHFELSTSATSLMLWMLSIGASAVLCRLEIRSAVAFGPAEANPAGSV